MQATIRDVAFMAALAIVGGLMVHGCTAYHVAVEQRNKAAVERGCSVSSFDQIVCPGTNVR